MHIDHYTFGHIGIGGRDDVSITAEPFFRRLGFKIVRRRIKIYRNRAFKQAVMIKPFQRAGTRSKH